VLDNQIVSGVCEGGDGPVEAVEEPVAFGWRASVSNLELLGAKTTVGKLIGTEVAEWLGQLLSERLCQRGLSGARGAVEDDDAADRHRKPSGIGE
jgi:hypothetical protein